MAFLEPLSFFSSIPPAKAGGNLIILSSHHTPQPLLTEEKLIC